MQIRYFEVKGLHGFIDAKVDFYRELTIIVGRNGSGKTSVLDLISHLIRLDIDAIRKARFDSVSLTLVDEKIGQVLVSAINTEQQKTLSLKIGDSTAYELSLDFPSAVLNFESEIGNKGFGLLAAQEGLDERSIRRWARLIPENQWLQCALKIKANTQLTFVRLDRTVLAVDSKGSVSIDGGMPPPELTRGSSRSASPKDPIDDVVQVMRRKNLQFRRAADRIQRSASSDLIKLHFMAPSETLSRKAPTERQLRSKVVDLKNKVKKSHLIANAPDIASTIDKFFDEFESLLDRAFPRSSETKKRAGRRTLSEETLQVMIGIKEQQISELLRVFENEQEQTSGAYSSIKHYLDIAANFFDESGKTLKFSPDNMELGFVISKISPDSPDAVEPDVPHSQEVRSIKELSSGERQVLIVLTYLAFLAGDNSIFIIDEPELSLHVTWQSKLIPALRELRPKNCQIVLATHAPEIAGRAKQNTFILRPSYLPKGDDRGSD